MSKTTVVCLRDTSKYEELAQVKQGLKCIKEMYQQKLKDEEEADYFLEGYSDVIADIDWVLLQINDIEEDERLFPERFRAVKGLEVTWTISIQLYTLFESIKDNDLQFFYGLMAKFDTAAAEIDDKK